MSNIDIIALINNVSFVINMAINYTVISFTPLHDHRMDFHWAVTVEADIIVVI